MEDELLKKIEKILNDKKAENVLTYDVKNNVTR